MNIGIVCYASVGGSGIVATELAKVLAGRGHDVRLLSTEPPFRLGDFQAGLAFHAVQTPGYPLFREPQYLLPLANKLVEVSREFSLDVIHAHYAIPHAAAAYLAKQILSASGAPKVPCVITTLHGTDVTLIGSDRSYSETAAFCIDQSDGVTAVSNSLRADTYREMPVHADIRVISNFLDCRYHRRQPNTGLEARYRGTDPATKLVVHVSNFRPVKRGPTVVEIFRRIREHIPSRLLLVGDGPDLSSTYQLAKTAGLGDAVEPLGEQELVVPILSVADLFLLPSSQESFGLAALEAMACEVPVVASSVGGLPEIIEHNVSGFLHPTDDTSGMAASAVALLTDPDLHQRVSAAGWRTVQERFCADHVVPRYEAFYREVLTRNRTEVSSGENEFKPETR